MNSLAPSHKDVTNHELPKGLPSEFQSDKLLTHMETALVLIVTVAIQLAT